MINIDKIKKNLLTRAIQGKLVEQRPEEGTGEELLKLIQQEKQRLIKEGKIKREKLLPIIEESEIPFEIPFTWKWVRLNTICDSIYAGGDKPEDFVKEKDEIHNIPVVANGIENNGIIGYTKKTRARTESITIAGRGTIGFSVYRKYEYFPIVRLIVVEQNKLIYPLFLNLYFQVMQEKSTGTSIPQLTVPMVIGRLVPLPPYEEQKRIANKLDDIFTELDKIEEKQKKLQFIQENMKLKILKLAYQGKLVEQRSEEGTGEKLFNYIQQEKQQLIKEGKIKKEKELPTIEDSEFLFDVPSTWKWVRIGQIFNHSAGKSLNSSDTEGTKYTYITTSNVYWNKFILNDLKSMFYKESELDKCTAKKGDLLVLEGGDIGRAAIWNYDYDMRIQNHIHRLRPLHGIDVNFFYYLFYLYKTFNMIDGRGIGLQGLSANKLKAIIMPLPPFEEQKRIVAKIEELLPLCKVI